MQKNPIISTDFYSLCSNTFASDKAKELSVYNYTNRYSPKKAWAEYDLAYDSRMTMYGLNFFIQEELSTKITKEHLEEALNYVNRSHSFGGPLPFDANLWKRVINECDGYLPIKIKSIPEGSTFFPTEPIIQVMNTNLGFGELAAHVEARLVGAVSKASAIATMLNHWRARLKEQIIKDLTLVYGKAEENKINDVLKWAIHNFGSRACDSYETSVLTGLSHLLIFNGTDNTDAGLEAYRLGCEDSVASSILALAHRNCQSYGNDIDAVNAIASVPNAKIVSCVADCYDFYKTTRDIVNIAKNNPNTTYVIRPDSGNGLDCILHIINIAIENGVCKYENGIPLPTNVRYIYGDSVNPKSQRYINDTLRDRHKIPSTLWGIFGVGGWIVNNSTRDRLSSAYKLAAIGDSYEPVVKLSESKTKLSVPYLNAITRPNNMLEGTVFPSNLVEYENDTCRLIYKNGDILSKESFKDIRSRAVNDFEKYEEFSKLNPDFGTNRECLGKEIIDYQNEIYGKYKGV